MNELSALRIWANGWLGVKFSHILTHSFSHISCKEIHSPPSILILYPLPLTVMLFLSPVLNQFNNHIFQIYIQFNFEYKCTYSFVIQQRQAFYSVQISCKMKNIFSCEKCCCCCRVMSIGINLKNHYPEFI